MLIGIARLISRLLQGTVPGDPSTYAQDDMLEAIAAVFGQYKHQCKRHGNINNIMFVPIWHTNLRNRLCRPDTRLVNAALYFARRNKQLTLKDIAMAITINEEQA